MTAPTTSAPSRSPDRLYWREGVARYERPSVRHSLLDLATSVVPYLVLRSKPSAHRSVP